MKSGNGNDPFKQFFVFNVYDSNSDTSMTKNFEIRETIKIVLDIQYPRL